MAATNSWIITGAGTNDNKNDGGSCHPLPLKHPKHVCVVVAECHWDALAQGRREEKLSEGAETCLQCQGKVKARDGPVVQSLPTDPGSLGAVVRVLPALVYED